MHPPPIAVVDWSQGTLDAPGLRTSERKLADVGSIFNDQHACAELDPGTLLYRVWWWEPVAPGTEGGLFWGGTEIQPGRVGNEYFMTRGHRHALSNRAEFYGTVAGHGRLVLRDASGSVRVEEMAPGSLHYIAGEVAHRVVNTGDTALRFVACWPSDAGHDYDIADANGFGARIVEEDGIPTLILANPHER